MHTYARGFTCIRQHLKEKVVWGIIILCCLKWENKTNKLKSLLFLRACKFWRREAATLAAQPQKKKKMCLIRILRTLRE